MTRPVDPVPYPRLMHFVRLDEAAVQFAPSRKEFLRDFVTLSDKERAAVARDVYRSRKEAVR